MGPKRMMVLFQEPTKRILSVVMGFASSTLYLTDTIVAVESLELGPRRMNDAQLNKF